MFGSKLFKLQRANGCCRGVLLRKTDDFTKTNLHELSILSIMFDLFFKWIHIQQHLKLCIYLLPTL